MRLWKYIFLICLQRWFFKGWQEKRGFVKKCNGKGVLQKGMATVDLPKGPRHDGGSSNSVKENVVLQKVTRLRFGSSKSGKATVWFSKEWWMVLHQWETRLRFGSSEWPGKGGSSKNDKATVVLQKVSRHDGGSSKGGEATVAARPRFGSSKSGKIFLESWMATVVGKIFLL